MTMTFIPGYKATVTLNNEDVSAIGNVVSLNLTRNVMVKNVFGAGSANSLGGQRSGTFSASGHVAAEKVAALVAMFDSDTSIDFSIQIGDASGPTDGGTYTGKCNISSFTIEANADGEWDWSIQATTDGTVEHTPPSG